MLRQALPLLACVLAGCPKPPPSTVLAAPEDLDEAGLNAVVRELVPLVEAAAGARFEAVPFARVGRAPDLERIVQAEADASLAALYPEVPEWLRARVVRGSGAEGVSGKYALRERILLVAPEGMVATASLLPEDPLALDHVTRLVLAHELTHALQDQVAHIGPRFTEVPDRDAFEALRAVTEGHAGLVAERVAVGLGLEEAAAALDLAQGWGPEGPLHPEVWPVWALYGQGRTFVAWHEARGGLEATWAVLRDPPRRSRTSFVPSEYGREAAVDPALVLALGAPERELADGRWLGASSPLVEVELRERLRGVPADALEAVLASVGAGASRAAERDGRGAAAWLLELPGGASALLDLHVDHADAIGAALGAAASAERVSFDHPAVDAAIRVTVGPGPAGPEVNGLWVAAGDRVVAVEARGFRPGIRLDRAVRAVLDGETGP